MKIYNLNSIVNEDLNYILNANLPWSNLKNKTFLISGGAGFLASYLTMSLLLANDIFNLNVTIICLVRSMQSVNHRLLHLTERKDLIIRIHDVSNPLPDDFICADYVIHSASQASPKYYGIDPVGTLLPNLQGTINLLNYAKKNKSEKFLFFSSGEVYGEPLDTNQPVTEDDYGYLNPMHFRSCYAESKRIGETLCVSWSKQFGLNTSVVRPFHTYGPGMLLNDGRVFADFVSDVVAKRDIVLKSDGAAIRAFCYISDATIGFFTVLFYGNNAEAYNVANPYAEISVKNLAHLISDLFPEKFIKVTQGLKNNDNSYIKSPISRSLPSIDKIKKLGWEPGIMLKYGFKRTIESYLI